MWPYVTPGIPDADFDRLENVPITKEEIRSIVISKLRLKKNFSVIDVGCGSGSITIEICIQTDSESIYAIDQNEMAIQLTRKNLFKFNLKANVIHGKAQDILPTLPNVDAIVVGGSGGHLEKIVELCVKKLKPGGRIVIDTILIESMSAAVNVINRLGLADIDITMINISKGKLFSLGTMLIARNPVIVISATKPI
jgi:cobalt-precorrin-6B (C15)-methyltransferase